MWAPHVRKSVDCELLLLGYIKLQMAGRENWDHERLKVAIETIRSKQMGSDRVRSVQRAANSTAVMCTDRQGS